MRGSRARQRHLVTALLVAVAPIGITACSTSTSSPATSRVDPFTPPTAPSASSQHLCSLVTPTDIASTLGISVRPVFAATHGRITTCSYLSSDRTAAVSIHFTTGATAATIATSRALFVTDGETIIPVTAPDGNAFDATATSGPATVSSGVVLEGKTMVSVTAQAPVAQVQALTSEVVDKL